jgi:1-aminocyclopropane-1-carboxylate deaminase/D-cysteine desulfhydrase-like pyridoxal-dependent ACC family enzyme
MAEIFITPINKIGNIFVKRDDLFQVANVCGGKARTCWYLSQNAKGLVTASSRYSPQALIVASIAKELRIPCNLHMPSGKETWEMQKVSELGGNIIQHQYGYNSVIIRRAKDNSWETGFKYIPFGMECDEAVKQTSLQVKDIPKEVKRIVIPVGSGMSLAGLLTGLRNNNLNIPVLGVVVGGSPFKRLTEYALFWQQMCTLVKSNIPYDNKLDRSLGDIKLDPVYEAKCVEFLEDNDLFWIIGNRGEQSRF